MKRKAISILLVLVMLVSLMPVFDLSALATTTDSDSGALAALGIDTSAAPDGYDPLSTDNPYGKNTVEISPVYELYTIGLTSGVTYGSPYSTTSASLQNGNNTESHATSNSDTLRSTLYGSNKWGDAFDTASEILGAGAASTAATGTTTATGDYTLITSGTVNSTDTSFPTNGYLKDATNASANLGSDFKFALSSVASGNFDGNTNGLAGQTAMVYTSDYSSNGGLYLRFGNTTTGAYGSSAKTLLGTDKKIGNPTLTYDGKLVEDFAQNPYQLQNYLQVATGDWNGDGRDEVAVYIPEAGNSRIVVYALQLTSADDKDTAYLDPAKWSVVWTYYLREGSVVSNMVSLVSGDVNQDGTDDLAATWGYYYGPAQNAGSTAVVMFGAKGTAMLNNSQQFNLTYGSSNIVRASFAFGDMAGSDSDVLILCGQSDADLKAGKTYSRYVALYSWNGAAFTSSVYQNFDLFAKKDGKYIWTAMSTNSDKFYSLPLCTANAAVISQGISGGGDLLYFDSLIIEYTKDGLNIKETWDKSGAMQQNTGSPVEYVEYGAVAGDLTGKTGAAAIFTMTQTLSATSKETVAYTVTGSHQEPVYSWLYYYQNWFYEFFGIKSWYLSLTGYTTVTDTKAVSVGYSQLTMGKAYMVAVDPSTNTGSGYYNKRTQVDFSTAICLANTDKDSSYMNYSGKHYYTYTDPEVLAVLASPPYFSDLINRSDLSGSYAESTTSYSSTSGGGSGYNVSSTITIGAYVSFEQDIEVFGIKVASVEAEAQITAGFTFEMEQTATLEQTVTYSATAGEDMVAFYSIPMEIYEYTSYVADGTGGYKAVLTTVNIPHEASVKLLSLKDYESIAKDYSVLPSIADNVLTHVVGDPSSYPSGTAGYNVIAQYNGTATAVGFSSTEGGSGISQKIAMSKETTTAFSASTAVEAKAGAGAGGFKVGVIAGAEVGAGFVLISTDGSSFSGEMQNMPIEAQSRGYGMNWKIFCYKYSNGGTSFPVVSYIVSDVQSPPTLPDDFEQNISATTSNAITLDWSYDKTVAGFKLYRYYEFPDGSGSYEIAYVPFTSAESYDSTTGTYHFSYKDTNNGAGLSPYTEYLYQIKTVCATNPKESIYSEPMSCRTKTTVGYPTITISGLSDGKLPIYPDANTTVSVSVANPDAYKGLDYQWQKLIDGNWTDLSGKIATDLTISNAGTADKGIYRCRVNAIYYDSIAAQNYYISAYSDEIETAYTKRTPTYTNNAASLFTATENTTSGDLEASIELHSAISGHTAAPTGNVTFTVKGTDYEYSQTVALQTSNNTTKYFGEAPNGENKYYSTANLSISDLPDGVYTVTAYYGGSRVFKDMQTSAGVLVVIGAGSAYSLSLASSAGGNSVTKFEYDNEICPTLVEIKKDPAGKITSEPVFTDVKYELHPSGSAIPLTPTTDTTADDFTPGSATPNVGSYTLCAYVSGNLVTSQNFTVVQRPVTVTVENKSDVSAGNVTANPPVLKYTGFVGTAYTALNLTTSVINSAGNAATLDNNTLAGKYTVTACISTETPADLYNNYSVTYVSGTYIIVGATHKLTIVAAPYTDPAGTRPVGTIGISDKTGLEAYYSADTAVMLYATPNPGYQVDKWTVVFANGTTKTEDGGTTYSLTTEAQAVTVTVTFKPAEISLATVAQPNIGGTVTCADKNYTSPAVVSYGADFTFTATPKAGYHFSKWEAVPSATLTPVSGDPNSITLTVGIAPTTLFAYFERDSYTLTLSGDITAYYMYDHDNDSTTPKIEKYITSGTSVPGDTQITVLPKTGYQAASGAKFIVNTTATTDFTSHTFVLTQNTTVSLDTVRNNYAVTVSAANGSVAATVDGVAVTDAALASVKGGSGLTFTAHADRGYVFDHWTVDGTDVAGSNATLTISQLGANTNIVAVFKANTAYTATASVSSASRGTMYYTLYDIYGAVVGTANTAMPAGGLTVYKGERITFSVTVVSGSTMEQWKINSDNIYTTQKTYDIPNISGNITAVAYLKAASSYYVYFPAATNGTLTAKDDGAAINTGTLQFGGSKLEFFATPAAGYMLDYWTVTSGTPTATEGSAVLDAGGKTVTTPTYTIDPLRQTITVRAHFTALVTNSVTLPAGTTMGVSAITYVTPILPTDDGTRTGCTSENVRTGGTVVMTFTPNSGYATSVAILEAAVKADVKAAGATVSVTENSGVFTVTVSNLTEAITLDESDLFRRPITVPSGVTASPNPAKPGETVTLTIKPAANYTLATLTLSNGSLIGTVSASKLTYTFTMPDAAVTVNATFTYSAPSGGGGGGGSGSTSITVPASGNGSSIDIGAKVEGGIAALEMDGSTLGNLSGFTGVLTLDLSGFEDVIGATIPEDAFGAIAGASGLSGLSISLPDAGVTFDSDAIAAISAAGSGDVSLTAEMIDTGTLTPEQQALIGDRPVLDLTLTVGGSTVSDFGDGSVSVSVPYTLAAGEDPNAIVVWYLNDKGILEAVTGQYDAATHSVVFTTDHFSKYVIGALPFDDVSRDEWYFDSVSFAFANGLFSGTGDATFDPDTAMTRAMLVTVLWRMENEPSPVKASSFKDVIAGEWYAEAVAWAAENGIISGYGNDLFGTDDVITREQMALILMNYAKYKDYDVSATADLRSFTDNGKISNWAKTAMQWANAEGLIGGTGGNVLDPGGDAARCQVAAILQRFIQNIVE